jgi:hypothetical protein
MSDYFWWAVNYIYDHRLTPAEGAGACASGATVGSPGGYAVAGAGCGISVVSDIISKFFDIHIVGIPEPISISTYMGPQCEISNSCPYYEGSDYCPAPENKPCSDLGNDSCPVPDFGGFGTNSNDYPTVSSGWV